LAAAVHAELEQRFGQPLYARIDLIPDSAGQPVISELELVEPHLYLGHAFGAAQRLAKAVHSS
jgi:hypothetical protein